MAKNVTLTWVQDKQFVGTDDSKHSIVISSQDERNGTGMVPSQLLLLALASCTAYDVVGILEKRRQHLTGLRVNVTGEQEPDPPWPFRHITVEYIFRGKGLKEKDVVRAIELSETKYCSVAATLRPAAEIHTRFEIIDEG
jgi:putative redox protein